MLWYLDRLLLHVGRRQHYLLLLILEAVTRAGGSRGGTTLASVGEAIVAASSADLGTIV